MPEWLYDILSLVLTPAIFVAAGAYLFKAFLTQIFERDIAAFKVRLECEASSAKDRLHNELKAHLFEHKTKFSLLHQKQSKAFAKVYELLVRATSEIYDLVNQEADEAILETAKISINDLESYYRVHEIYFPDKIQGKMEEILSAIKLAYKQYKAAAESKIEDYLPDHADALKKMQIDVPLLKEHLAELFREQLTADLAVAV